MTRAETKLAFILVSSILRLHLKWESLGMRRNERRTNHWKKHPSKEQSFRRAEVKADEKLNK